VSEHRPADEAGGDESGFLEEEPRDEGEGEHPLEGGQGDEVDEAQIDAGDGSA
jgi:hypothetical protein